MAIPPAQHLRRQGSLIQLAALGRQQGTPFLTL